MTMRASRCCPGSILNSAQAWHRETSMVMATSIFISGEPREAGGRYTPTLGVGG